MQCERRSPALAGEAGSAQLRPGAQLGWEKLADHSGTSAPQLPKGQTLFRKESLPAPSKVQTFCLPPEELMLNPSSQDRHPTVENK